VVTVECSSEIYCVECCIGNSLLSVTVITLVSNNWFIVLNALLGTDCRVLGSNCCVQH